MSANLELVPDPSVGVSITTAAERISHYVDASLAPATRRAYACALKGFYAWGGSSPATPEVVAAYLVHLAEGADGRGPRGASTLSQHLAAIRWEHLRRFPNTQPPTSHPGVADTLAGIRRERARCGGATGSRPARKAAATVEHLAAMVGSIDRGRRETLKGKRDKAILLFGFASAMRRSELAALEVEDLEEVQNGSGGGLLVTVRRGKADQEGRGHVRAVPRGKDPNLCPVSALLEWMWAAGINRVEGGTGGGGRVFRSVTRHGELGAGLQPAVVGVVVKAAARAAGFDPADFGGHSLRAGFVTSAAERGASTERIMDHTGHASAAMVRIYTRRADAFKDHAGEGLL